MAENNNKSYLGPILLAGAFIYLASIAGAVLVINYRWSWGQTRGVVAPCLVIALLVELLWVTLPSPTSWVRRRGERPKEPPP